MKSTLEIFFKLLKQILQPVVVLNWYLSIWISIILWILCQYEFYVIIPEKIIASKVREGNFWHPWCSILSTRGKELLTTIPLKAQLSNSSRRLSISMLNYHIQYKFVVPCEIHVRILRASYCYNKDKWRLGMIVLKSIHIHMQNMFLFK